MKFYLHSDINPPLILFISVQTGTGNIRQLVGEEKIFFRGLVGVGLPVLGPTSGQTDVGRPLGPLSLPDLV